MFIPMPHLTPIKKKRGKKKTIGLINAQNTTDTHLKNSTNRNQKWPSNICCICLVPKTNNKEFVVTT